MAQLIKTVGGLAIASVKTINGLAIASVKTIGGVDNTAAASGQHFSDAFGDTLSAWTVEASGWAISGGQAQLAVSGAERHMIYASPTDTDNQYCKATYVSGATTSECGFIFRATAPGTATGDYVSINTNGNIVWGGLINGDWQADYASVSHAVANGSVIRIYMTGTSTSKRIYFYDDGTLVDAGSGYTFGGNSGATAGKYLGVYGALSNGEAVIIDDWYGGDGTDVP